MRRNRGFTILEIAIVMFMLAILTSMATSRLVGSDRSQALDNAARRFASAVELIREKAVLNAQPVGFHIEADRWFASVWRSGDWVPYPESEIAGRLSEGFEFEYVGDYIGTGRDASKRPPIVTTDTGEILMPEIAIVDRTSDDAVQLLVDEYGRLQWVRVRVP